jgi:fructose-bisphosphate aldolase class II
VKQTGVDALAVAIGTSHGVYKFTKEPDHTVLVMDRIVEIHKRLPDTHLVMHGSSSVPQELLAMINQYGGQIKPTWGVPVAEIQMGIQHGVRKINVDTDTRLAITAAIRKFFVEHPDKFDPREYMTEARTANQVMIADRMKAFGQAGHATDFS